MAAIALCKEDAAWYAQLAVNTASNLGASTIFRGLVGPQEDEALLVRCSSGTWLLYVGGSVMDNPIEWLHNVSVALGVDAFADVTAHLSSILDQHVREGDTCVFVGYSRGAAIVLALAAASRKDDYVVTLGDPGLVRILNDAHVTSLWNEFDAVYGIVAQPSGSEYKVSSARVTRAGWYFSLNDIGGHLNYASTLQNEAERSALASPSFEDKGLV